MTSIPIIQQEEVKLIFMTEESKEKLGQAIDRVDNMLHALVLPLPPQMHIDSFKSILPEIVKELKEGYSEVTGENPWD
jgi:vacuolar-type H+-ATPase subunit F/Vma7